MHNLLCRLAMGASVATLGACGWGDRPGAPAGTVAAQETSGPPASAPDPFTGPDSARTRARIDSVFARFDRPGSPGCVVAVMRAGEIVFGRGYGTADLATGEPLTIESAFDGASMAKQFLAFSIALLAGEGRLSLDDPIHKHLPELPDYGARITLRHLLHHTSGIRDYDAVWLSGRADLKPEMLLGLSFAPGTRHVYDDTGYALLERVVERVSGKPIGEFQRERIWAPLGMGSTGSGDGRTPAPRRVAPYAPREGGGYERAGDRDRGGFTVTPRDLARWDRNFYDARVGGPEVIRMMASEGRLANGETIPYALGLHTEPYRGLRRQWHGGLAGGYRSQFMRYPDQRTSILVQCNVYQMAEPNSLAQAVTDIVLEDAIARAEGQPARAVPPPPAGELRRLAGLYVNRELPGIRPVRIHEGRLQMRQWITWHETTHLGGGRFRVSGLPLTLVFRAGTVEEHWDGVRTAVVLRAPPPLVLSDGQLDAYTGRFRSDELGATWTIRRDGQGLRAAPAVGRARVGLLRPAGPDAFSDHEYVLLIFTRDAQGRVSGFTVSTPRVQNLEFTRRGGGAE